MLGPQPLNSLFPPPSLSLSSPTGPLTYEIKPYCVVLAGLEPTLQTRLDFNSKSSARPSAEIKGVSHYTQTHTEISLISEMPSSAQTICVYTASNSSLVFTLLSCLVTNPRFANLLNFIGSLRYCFHEFPKIGAINCEVKLQTHPAFLGTSPPPVQCFQTGFLQPSSVHLHRTGLDF